MAAATLKDLAQYTGYSIGTISNYITGKTPVSKDKQERIEEAIDTLHYKVNIAARMLKTNEYKTISILIPDFKNVFLVSIVSHIERRLADSGYDMVVLSYNQDAYKEKKLLEYLSQRSDAILYVPRAEMPEKFIKGIQETTPIITFDETIESMNCDKILLNNIDSADALLEQLFAKGHREVGMITGLDTSYTSNRRQQGYRRAYARHGFPLAESLIVYGDYSKDAGFLCCERLVSSNPDLTAVFVVGYPMTLGALSYLKKSGLDQEITVIGYDASDIADVVSPSIGYIYQPYHEIAERATTLALKRASKNNEGFPQFIEISAELRNIEPLPFVNQEKAPTIEPSKIPYPIALNRLTKNFIGGKLLDEWQHFNFPADTKQSEEVFLSMLKTHEDSEVNIVPQTMLITPESTDIPISTLLKQNKSAFLGEDYKHVNLSIRMTDIATPQIASCNSDTHFSTDFSSMAKQQPVALHIIKTRFIDGSTPYLFLGFRPGVTQKDWQNFFETQNIEGMLSCLHKIAVQEDDVFVVPAGMPCYLTQGIAFLSLQLEYEHKHQLPQKKSDIPQALNSFCYETYDREELFDHCKVEPITILKTSMIKAERLARYIECKNFRSERYTFSQTFTLPDFAGYRVLIIVKGSCAFHTDGRDCTLNQGRALFVPSEVTDLELTPLNGQTVIFVCYPTELATKNPNT